MTKKVKNASQSGATTKVNKTLPAIKDEIKEIDDADSFAVVATPVPLPAVEDTVVENVTILDMRGKYPRPRLTDEPILEIANQVIELTEINKGENQLSGLFFNYYYSNDNILVSTPRAIQRGCYSGDVLSREDVRVWKATVNGVDIFMTQGSVVMVDKALTGNGAADPWDLESRLLESGKAKPRSLVVIGSKIRADALDIDGKVVVNNSTILGKDIYLTNAKIACTSIYSEQMASIEGSSLNNVEIQGKRIYDERSSLNSVVLTGFNGVRLKDVQYDGLQEFSLGVCTGDTKLDIRISKIRLTQFTAYLSPREGLEDFNTNSYRSAEIIIERRVDYGYFSGITPIPFVRLNDSDILVGNKAFSTQTVSPMTLPPEEPKELAPAAFPGSYVAPFTRNTSFVGYTATGIPMDKLWLDARETLTGFGHWTGKKQPLGRTGERLVDTLVEQIKSRNHLYIELSSFVR